jgi:hypothetical protein
MPVQTFVFNSNATSIEAGLPGHPAFGNTINIEDFVESVNLGGTSHAGLIKAPMEKIIISDNATLATFVFGMDMDGIIEVYDNNTPLNKTDDVVVLANGWWNRMSVSVIEE